LVHHGRKNLKRDVIIFPPIQNTIEKMVPLLVLPKVLSFLCWEEQVICSEVSKGWKSCMNVEKFVLKNSRGFAQNFERTFPLLLSEQGCNMKSFRVESGFWVQKNTALVTVDILKALAEKTKLLELHLTMCSGLSQHDHNPLKSLSLMTSLQKLDLAGGNYSDDNLKPLAKLSNVKELNLSINRFVSDLAIKILFQSSSSSIGKHLVALDLSYTSVSDESLKCIRTLANLKQLHLMNCAITQKGLENMLAYEHGPKLEKLNLLNCTSVSKLEFLKSCRYPESISALMYSFPPSSTVNPSSELENLSHLTGMQELVLVDIDQLSASCISALTPITSLQTLSIRCNSIQNKCLESFKFFSQLKSIDIFSATSDPLKLGFFEGLSSLKNLEYISASSATSTKPQPLDKMLSQLSHFTETLTYFSIDIPGYYLDNSGFNFISSCHKLSHLNVGLSGSIASHQTFGEMKTLIINKTSQTNQVNNETVNVILSSSPNLKKLVVTNLTNLFDLLEIICRCNMELEDLELDLNVLKSEDSFACSIDGTLQAIAKLNGLKRLSLYGNEKAWSINKSIVPLARSLYKLTELELSEEKLASCSSLLFERLFPHTSVQVRQ